MEGKKFYFVVLRYLGRKRKAVIVFDPDVIDSYLKRGYAIGFICPVPVLHVPID